MFWYLERYSWQALQKFGVSLKFSGCLLRLVSCSMWSVSITEEAEMWVEKHMNHKKKSLKIYTRQFPAWKDVSSEWECIFSMSRRLKLKQLSKQVWSLISSGVRVQAQFCAVYEVLPLPPPFFLTVCVGRGNFLLACPVWCVQGQRRVLRRGSASALST